MTCVWYIHVNNVRIHVDSIVLYAHLHLHVGQSSEGDLGKKTSTETAQTERGDVEAPPMRTVSSRMKNLMRDELLINVRKFETQVHAYMYM